MSGIKRRPFRYFLIRFLASSCFVASALSEVTKCNLSEGNIAENKECMQHCERSERGDGGGGGGGEDCTLTYPRNTTSVPLSPLCSQVCDPADNDGSKCRLRCHASDECVQHCTPGHCPLMECSERPDACEQLCTAGGCEEMVCNSEKCYQYCQNGGCNMRCGPEVKYCEQVCTGGNCRMTCEGKTCRAYCPLGTCDTRGPNSAIMTTCTRQDKKHCVQACPREGCYCKAAGRLRNCKQACDSEQCRSVTCHSKVCRQDCRSNCSLTCSADFCTQRCSGSGCHFQCAENVKTCHQDCVGGHCVFNCAAKFCTNDCSGGHCVFNRVGDAVGVYLDAKCDYRHNGRCEPMCKECVHGGHDLKCSDDTCRQTCSGGRCDNVKCASRECDQSCGGGRCEAMECKGGQCLQTCSGGGCGHVECTAEKCAQTCLGGCRRMTCRAKVCTQHCFLGGCTLECPPGVERCEQKCYVGRCNFKCHAKFCTKRCPPGKCFEASGGVARGVADDVRRALGASLVTAVAYISSW